MHGRIQTWYPFNIQFYINGREWMANLLDKKGVQFDKVDNCFTWVDDFSKASQIANSQFIKKWPRTLDSFSKIINPLTSKILPPGGAYYWTTHQSEVATDILFKNESSLDRIYNELVYHSIVLNSKVLYFFANFTYAKSLMLAKRPSVIYPLSVIRFPLSANGGAFGPNHYRAIAEDLVLKAESGKQISVGCGRSAAESALCWPSIAKM